MSKTLAQIQEDMQAAILNGDKTILKEIKESTREQKATLLNIYQHAYGARLLEFLENDFPMTTLYLGEEEFARAAKAYVAACPSNNPNARWFGARFPAFLKEQEPWRDIPECSELAELEKSLNDAFDASDETTINQADLASLNPADWPKLTFTPHPSIQRLHHKTNAAMIWKALSKEETPPTALVSQMPEELIVWRGQTMARYRVMTYDEAMIFDEAAKGANFSQLCEMLGTYWPSDDAPGKAAGYLQAWLSSEFLTRAEIIIE